MPLFHLQLAQAVLPQEGAHAPFHMELTIKAASQSSRQALSAVQEPSAVMPLWEKDAAIGMVPYIHNGDAIPNALAMTIPSRFSPIERNAL